jgi:hypothetical protein
VHLTIAPYKGPSIPHCSHILFSLSLFGSSEALAIPSFPPLFRFGFQPRLPYWDCFFFLLLFFLHSVTADKRLRASRTPSLRYGVRLSSPLWCLVPVLYSVNDRCNRTLPLGKSRLSPAQQGGHFTRSPFQWTGLKCSWQFSTLPPIPHRTFAWYDGHMSMLSCAACGHPGTSHEWNVRHERGACKVRHNGRRCMCSHYVPKTDERKPANRLIGRVLRRPKGR